MTPEVIVSSLLLLAVLVALVIDIMSQRKVIELMDYIQDEIDRLSEQYREDDDDDNSRD